MNPMKDSLKIMDDIMNGVIQTEMWVTIQQTDPMIKEAESKLEASLNKLKGTPQEELIEELFDAALNLTSAFDYPAILYGMRIAQAIQEVTSDPTALSQHIMDRVANHRGGE